MEHCMYEPAKQLPCYGSFDVAVIGGGFAGVAAALSAARNGARTCLIEKEFALGGLGTLGLVVDYLPLCDGNGIQLVGGIGEELLKCAGWYGQTNFPDCWREEGDLAERKHQRYELTYNPAAMVLAMEELLLNAKVQLFYDTRFCDVLQQDNTITAICVENKSGRGAILSKCFVDASGDADVCYLAGERTASSDQNVCAWWFYSESDGQLKLNRKTDNFYKITPDMPLYSGTRHEDVTALCIETRRRIRELTNVVNGKGDGIADFTELSQDGTAEVLPQETPGAMYPALLPSIPQYRMTRRLLGAYELREEDDLCWFDDCIGLTGDWRKRGPRYSIPYRSICAVKTKNLLTAGRCISTTESGWDIMRVIPVCAVTGEAAGAAAALAAKHTNGDVHSIDIRELQQLLKAQQVILDPDLFPKES